MPRIGIGIGLGRTFYAGSFADAYNARVLADGGTIEATPCVNAASTLLQSASLLLIPSGYKSGIAYAQLPNNGNGDLTWTRASTASRTNSSGLIESVSSGVPRLSYMYGSCPALLLEPQRTNLVTYSEDFSQTTWAKTRCSITANSTTAPDGNTTADTLVEDTTATSTHPVSQAVTLTAAAQTFSIYAKAANRNWIQLTLLSTANASAYFNLSNGTIGTVGSATTASIVNVGNGWYRCIITVTTASGANTLGVYPASADATNSFNGNGTASLYIWGAQIETGSFATTYIPTTSSTATRVADTFSRNNIYTNGLITSSGGTWYVELKNNVAYVRDAANRIGIGDTAALTTNAIILSLASTSSRLQIWKNIAGAPTSLYTTTTDNAKIAVKWNGTTADVFVNGVKVVSSSIFATSLMEYLNTSGIGVAVFIQSMALFSTPLSDSDCVSLTT